MFVGMKRASTGGGLRLGEILVEAGVVKSELVNQSLQIAKRTKMPLGRVLVTHAHLSDLLINNAVAVQQGVRDGRFTREYASKLIKTAHGNNLSVDKADALIAWERAYKTSFSELGKLFMASGIIAEENLWAAQNECKNEGAPLGAYLAEHDEITPELMASALKILVLCREQRISHPESILLLQKIHSENLSFEDAVTAMNMPELLEEKRVRLAELMVEANVMNLATSLEAIELSVEKKKMLGIILVEEGLINENLLDAALHLQEMVNLGILVREHAAELLGEVKKLDTPLDNVLYDLERSNKIARFILNCGLVPENEKNKLFDDERNMDINVGKVLLNSGLVSDKIIGYAAYFHKLIEHNVISADEATGVMHYSLRYRMQPEQALKKLGFQCQPDWSTSDKELQLISA